MALHLQNKLSYPILILSILLVQLKVSSGQGFAPALATWYGPPEGPGSGGACGFADDVGDAPYSAMISAGNANIFKSGHGCGNCYQVKCSSVLECSGQPITVTITDECPGACNNVPYHFDLSGHAFGALANPGQEDALRQRGQVDITFQRVPCNYPNTNIAFRVAEGVNPNYFATAAEYINKDGDIASMSFKPANNDWITMSQSWGEVWGANDIPVAIQAPLSFRITTSSGASIEADNAVPDGYTANSKYFSNVNF